MKATGVTQIERTLNYLARNVATASMVAEATGVPQKNICRYKRVLEKAGRLWEVQKKYCEKTGFKAWYLTCDPSKTVDGLLQLQLSF